MATDGPSRSSQGPSPKKRRVQDEPAAPSRPKRAKFHDARSILAQQSDAALNENGELNLQSFLDAREFEIKALEESMRLSKAAGSSRAFQLVPRGMRRRTASHNVKRVPKRLQARARREKDEDKTPTVTARRRKPRTTRARIRAETAKKLGLLAEKKRKWKLKAGKEREAGEGGTAAAADAKTKIQSRPPRPKIRRNLLNDPPRPGSKFRKRQINKTWLPTHLWHAKRARMTPPQDPLWRFAIPLTPNEKCYRPTHRASDHRGALVWDMSYMSTIGLYGSQSGIEKVLRSLGVTQESCWNTKGLKWRTGTRHWSGHLSRESKATRRLLCPATIIWNPQQPPSGADDGDVETAKQPQRQVLVRVHPAAFLEVFQELLKRCKMQSPQLYIEDLRFEIGSIELLGPASTEALLAVLRPYYEKPEQVEPHADMFRTLRYTSNSASLPLNSLLAFSVMDPRLHYPPKRADPSALADETAQFTALEMISQWPAETGLKSFQLFDRNARFLASKLPSPKAINHRRGTIMHGEDLNVTKADPPIPIILLATRKATGVQSQGSWTLLAPWKCIMHLWHSLVQCPLSSGGNPYFAGLQQLQQVAFENAQPFFPCDYLGTNSGVDWELAQRATRQADWDKRPKAKRVEWSSLDLGAGRKGEIGAGWNCELESLFDEEPATDGEPDTTGTENLSTDDMDVDRPEQTPNAAVKRKSGFLRQLATISKEDFYSASSPETTFALHPRSIINVKITILSRGSPIACARIYRLPTQPTKTTAETDVEVPSTEAKKSKTQGLPADLRQQWLACAPATALEPAKRGRSAKGIHKPASADALTSDSWPRRKPPPNQNDMDGQPLVPDARDLMGFVTAGAFNLAAGRPTAMGTLHAARAAEALRAAASRDEGKLCVVRNAGESVGWIARWEPIFLL